MTSEYTVLSAQDINPDSLIISAPTKKELNKGTQTMTSYAANIQYKCSDGVDRKLFIRFPAGTSFGVQRMYTFGAEETEANAKGYQMSYIFGDRDGLNDTQLKFKNLLDSVREKIAENIIRYAHSHKSALPATTLKDFGRKGLSAEDALESVKPLYSYPRDKETKEIDEKKSPRIYLKLNTRGERGSQILTRFKSQDGTIIAEPTTLNQRGKVIPVVHLDSLYFGSHGTTAYTVSAQLKPMEVVYRVEASGVPTADLVGATPELDEMSLDDVRPTRGKVRAPEPVVEHGDEEDAFAPAPKRPEPSKVSSRSKKVVDESAEDGAEVETVPHRKVAVKRSKATE